MSIRRYTVQATRIFKFIKSDIGRPFTDQASDLIYPEMADDAHEVLRTLVFKERQIPGKNGQWFSVRIMPYRTFDDRIDGLVITFINITELKRSEEKLNESEQIQRLLFNSDKDIIIKLSSRWKVLQFNEVAGRFFGVKRADAIGKDFMEMFIPESNRKKTEKELKEIMDELQDSRLNIQVKASGSKTPLVEWSVNILVNTESEPTGIILKAEGGSQESSDFALSGNQK